MKKFTLLAVLLLAFVTTAQGQEKDLIGTWRLVEYRHRPNVAMEKPDPAYDHIKVIAADGFTWTKTRISDDEVVSGASGIAVIEGNKYTEYITDVMTGMEDFINYKAEYRYTISFNRAHFIGRMGRYYVEEIWERVIK